MRGALGALALLCCVWAAAAAAQEQEPAFRVVDGDVTVDTDVVYLDARLDLDLSDEAKRALDNGVPLTIELEITVTRPRWWWFDKDVASLIQRYRLRFHALSRRYVLTSLNSGESRSYNSRSAMLAQLGQVSSLPLIDRGLLEPGDTYVVGLRARLDLDALPRPLRAGAYVSPQWRLVSEWFTWRLES
jgi:hypothetical protein